MPTKPALHRRAGAISASLFRRLFPSFLLGAVAVLGFAPFHFHVLPVACLAGLLLLCRSRDARGAAAAGFAFGFGLFIGGVSWVYVSLHDYGGMALPVAAAFTLLFCLYLACYPAVALALAWRFGVSPAARLLLVFPALWALSEWMRGWMFSGFPWLAFGYSQVPSAALAGYAPVLGVFGTSLAMAATAGALALGIEALALSPGAVHTKKKWPRVSAATALLLGILLVGTALLNREWTQRIEGEPTRVALLQGNIPQEMKWRPERALATLETYLHLARSADAALILLPETALPMFNVNVPVEYLDALTAHGRNQGGDLLVGVPELDPSGRYYNSVMSFGSAPTQTYRKHHLVPFGDYFPLRPLLGWIMELMHIPMSDFSHGEEVQEPMQVAGQKVAINICYEDAFGEEIIRQLPQATLLANFTNDAWWGNSIASEQHLQIAQMRALEAGRPLLRATNTGVSAIIDARGRIAASAPGFITTTVRGEVHGYAGTTPYVRWGNFAFIALSVMMVMLALVPRIFPGRTD